MVNYILRLLFAKDSKITLKWLYYESPKFKWSIIIDYLKMKIAQKIPNKWILKKLRRKIFISMNYIHFKPDEGCNPKHIKEANDWYENLK